MFGYKVTWWDITHTNYHTDFFVHIGTAYAEADVSYVHKSDNPDEWVRKFLQHLPLIDTTITKYEY